MKGEKMFTEEQINEKVREMKNAYRREYYKKNKEKSRKQIENWWKKKAEQELEREEQEK